MEHLSNEELRKLQLVELELLKKAIAFFEEHNIRYFALGGTLLGAVRHRGFIPWDDDVDIGLPREDYERFLRMYEAGECALELSGMLTDKNYPEYIIRLVNPSVLVYRNASQEQTVFEAFVDIFPLDGMPNNPILRKIHEFRILYRRCLFKLATFSKGANLMRRNRPLIERLLITFARVVPIEKALNPQRAYQKLDKTLKCCPYSTSDYLVNAMGAYKFREMFHKEHYGDGVMYPFEDIQIRGPRDYDFVLKQLYGDYMTPPSEEDKWRHHATCKVETLTPPHDGYAIIIFPFLFNTDGNAARKKVHKIRNLAGSGEVADL